MVISSNGDLPHVECKHAPSSRCLRTTNIQVPHKIGVPLCGDQSVSQDFVADTVDLGPTVKTQMKPKKDRWCFFHLWPETFVFFFVFDLGGLLYFSPFQTKIWTSTIPKKGLLQIEELTALVEQWFLIVILHDIIKSIQRVSVCVFLWTPWCYHPDITGYMSNN